MSKRSVMILLLLAAVSLPARADVVVWGMESWECGQRWYGVQLGHGGDVMIRSIQGAASGSQVPGAEVNSPNVRQSIVSVLAGESLYAKANGRVTDNPDGRANQALDAHILQINLKQSGGNAAHLPFSYLFDPPLLVPGGKLTGLIFTESYDFPPKPISGKPFECLNTEVHATIQFDEMPTRAITSAE